MKRIRSLIMVLFLSSMSTLLAAQEGRLVLDGRADVPGVGEYYSSTGEPPLNFPARVWDDGSWFSVVWVTGPFGPGVIGSVLLRDGVPILSFQDVMPDGRVVQSIYMNGFEAEGNQLLLRVNHFNENHGLYRYDGTGFELLTEKGRSLNAVQGFASGSSIDRIYSAKLYADGSLAADLTSTPIFDRALVRLQVAAGSVVGGAKIGQTGVAPPSGSGSEIQIICTSLDCYDGRPGGSDYFTCIVQPNSRRRLYRDGQIYAEDGDQIMPGFFISNVWITGRLDSSATGSTLLAFGGGSGGFPPPTTSGILLKNDVPFVWGGATLPGGHVAQHVSFENARLLTGDLVSWVERDEALPSDADTTLYIETTPVLSEGGVRVSDRFLSNWMEGTFETSPNGRYIVASGSLHPGGGLVWIDLLGTPAAPGQVPADGFEPNDTCAQSSFLGVDDQIGMWVAQAKTLTVQAGQPDYYSFDLGPQREVTVTLESDASACDLDLLLLDEFCLTILSQNLNAEDDPEIYLANPSDVWLTLSLEIRVAPGETYPNGVYDLLVFAHDLNAQDPIEGLCVPAAANSTGAAGRVLAGGSTSSAAADLTLTAIDLPANQFGYFLVSQTQALVPMVGGSQGTLCLGGAIGRYVNQVQNTGVAGTITLVPDPLSIPTPGSPIAVQPGESWSFQCWYRDLNPQATSNLSSGLSVTFE